jgi:hypothetical protein
MKFSKIRYVAVCIGTSVGVSTVGPVPAAHADAGWVLRASQTVTFDAATTAALLAEDLLTGTGKPCVPSHRTVDAGGTLTVETWWNPQTLAIRYDETASGTATISTDCTGTSVTVETEVSDYAPAGSPTLVQDGSQRATTRDPRDGTAYIAAAAEDRTDVLYYDPPASYSRGNAAITVRVTGYYTNSNRPSVPFQCQQATWPITPTPYGPVFWTTAPYVSAC